jgi:L-ascorbate metabolism protein UlaG (beta-lactamase superfamily)
MKHHHLNPQEAYQAYQDLNAKTMIPMHYGAFKLTDEPINEPEAWIDKIKEKHNADIYKMKVGEVLELGYTT